jgi:hypothetical protein
MSLKCNENTSMDICGFYGPTRVGTSRIEPDAGHYGRRLWKKQEGGTGMFWFYD